MDISAQVRCPDALEVYTLTITVQRARVRYNYSQYYLLFPARLQNEPAVLSEDRVLIMGISSKT